MSGINIQGQSPLIPRSMTLQAREDVKSSPRRTLTGINAMDEIQSQRGTLSSKSRPPLPTTPTSMPIAAAVAASNPPQVNTPINTLAHNALRPSSAPRASIISSQNAPSTSPMPLNSPSSDRFSRIMTAKQPNREGNSPLFPHRNSGYSSPQAPSMSGRLGGGGGGGQTNAALLSVMSLPGSWLLQEAASKIKEPRCMVDGSMIKKDEMQKMLCLDETLVLTGWSDRRPETQSQMDEDVDLLLNKVAAIDLSIGAEAAEEKALQADRDGDPIAAKNWRLEAQEKQRLMDDLWGGAKSNDPEPSSQGLESTFSSRLPDKEPISTDFLFLLPQNEDSAVQLRRRVDNLEGGYLSPSRDSTPPSSKVANPRFSKQRNLYLPSSIPTTLPSPPSTRKSPIPAFQPSPRTSSSGQGQCQCQVQVMMTPKEIELRQVYTPSKTKRGSSTSGKGDRTSLSGQDEGAP